MQTFLLCLDGRQPGHDLLPALAGEKTLEACKLGLQGNFLRLQLGKTRLLPLLLLPLASSASCFRRSCASASS